MKKISNKKEGVVLQDMLKKMESIQSLLQYMLNKDTYEDDKDFYEVLGKQNDPFCA